MSTQQINACLEIVITFDDYMRARGSGEWGAETSKEDVLMSMFRAKGIHMDGEKDMKPTPPVEIITDEKRGVFVIKQWQTNSL